MSDFSELHRDTKMFVPRIYSSKWLKRTIEQMEQAILNDVVEIGMEFVEIIVNIHLNKLIIAIE